MAHNKPSLLSLYSTRTQNTWRRGLALGNAPDARFLRYPTQNIPTCWYILALPPTPIPNANPKICVTPDANPRRQSVEYRWRWVPTQNAGVGHVYFIFLCRFHLRLYPTRTQFLVEYGLYVLVGRGCDNTHIEHHSYLV